MNKQVGNKSGNEKKETRLEDIKISMNPTDMMSMVNMDYMFAVGGTSLYGMAMIMSIFSFVNALLIGSVGTSIAAGCAVAYLVGVLVFVVIPVWKDVLKNSLLKI